VSAATTKKRKKSGLPSREEILTFFARNPGKAGKRELARAFGVKGNDRIGLKQLLRTMTDEGLLDKRRKALNRSEDLPAVSVLQVYGRDEDGELLAIPKRWDRDAKGPPPIVVLSGRSSGKRQGAEAGLSDQVLARVDRLSDHPLASYGGRVIKVLQKSVGMTLGIVEKAAHGFRLVPVDRKQHEMILDLDGGAEVAPGDLVSVEPDERRAHGMPRARLIERIGSMNDEKAISLIAILRHGIPNRFSPATVQAATNLKPIDLSRRTDWRAIPLITIDPFDAKDHDDAVQAEADRSPDNPGGWIVRVAIADVAAYVRPGTAFDKDALERGNSVYFPDRVVPMLPERISNDLCSLREDEDRPALAVEMIFNKNGQKIRHKFYRIAMRSHAKLSYEAAQAAIDGNPDGKSAALVEPVLKPLWAAYACLMGERKGRSPLDLDLPERKIVLTSEGKVDHIHTPPRLDAHKLIEEFMIQANVAAAETLEAHKSPVVYRVHDTPSLEKLEALQTFLSSLDLSFPKQGNVRAQNFNFVLDKVRDTEHEEAVNEIVLRSQSQAEYNPANIGHFGLNLRRYAHFTSPIRRYADLLVHRGLISALDLGKDGLAPDAHHRFAVIAQDISATERRAMVAERETKDRLIAGWLADRIGATFQARISGITKSGLFVRLTETGADGFIPISTLGDEYFVYDEKRHSLVGETTGATYQIGHPAEVRLIEALPFAGALRFKMVSGPSVVAKPKTRKPGRKGSGRVPKRR